MSYIGNNLQVAYPSYRVIDDISSGFNGVLKTFALRVAGSTPIPFPINPQQCLLSVNNIVQKPDSTGASGFTLTGSNIVFATAPTAGWSFFGTVLAGADYVNVGANFPAGTAAVPSVTFDESTGTGLFLASSNVLGITTGGVQRLVVNSSGFVGIGTSSPNALLQINKGSTAAGIATGTRYTVPFAVGADNGQSIDLGLETNSGAKFASIQMVCTNFGVTNGSYLTFRTSPDSSGTPSTDLSQERLRIDSSGRLLVGTTSARTNFATPTPYAPFVQFEASGALDTRSASLYYNGADAGGAVLWLGSSRGTVNGSNTIVQNSDELGQILFVGADGVKPVQGATIIAQVDGTPGLNDMPSRLIFATTADGSALPTERLRITSAGRVGIGTSSPSYALHLNSSGTTDIFIGTAGDDSRLYFTDTNRSIRGVPGGNLTFQTAAAERMRITNDGYMRLASGTGGVQFGGDTTAASALNDYEEGSWTPTVIGQTVPGTATYSIQNGTYRKTGSAVTVRCYLSWTGGTGSGGFRIAGLPFAAGNVTYQIFFGVVAQANIAAPAGSQCYCSVTNNLTDIGVDYFPAAGGSPVNNTYSANGAIYAQITYFVN